MMKFRIKVALLLLLVQIIVVYCANGTHPRRFSCLCSNCKPDEINSPNEPAVGPRPVSVHKVSRDGISRIPQVVRSNSALNNGTNASTNPPNNHVEMIDQPTANASSVHDSMSDKSSGVFHVVSKSSSMDSDLKALLNSSDVVIYHPKPKQPDPIASGSNSQPTANAPSVHDSMSDKSSGVFHIVSKSSSMDSDLKSLLNSSDVIIYHPKPKKQFPIPSGSNLQQNPPIKSTPVKIQTTQSGISKIDEPKSPEVQNNFSSASIKSQSQEAAEDDENENAPLVTSSPASIKRNASNSSKSSKHSNKDSNAEIESTQLQEATDDTDKGKQPETVITDIPSPPASIKRSASNSSKVSKHSTVESKDPPKSSQSSIKSQPQEPAVHIDKGKQPASDKPSPPASIKRSASNSSKASKHSKNEPKDPNEDNATVNTDSPSVQPSTSTDPTTVIDSNLQRNGSNLIEHVLSGPLKKPAVGPNKWKQTHAVRRVNAKYNPTLRRNSHIPIHFEDVVVDVIRKDLRYGNRTDEEHLEEANPFTVSDLVTGVKNTVEYARWWTASSKNKNIDKTEDKSK